MGRGGHATVFGLPNGGGLGVIRRSVSLSDLAQQADDLQRLGGLGVPVVQRTVGTYSGKPSWIFPPESRGIIHSSDDAFADSRSLYRIVGPDRLQRVWDVLTDAKQVFLRNNIQYDDLQGVITSDGNFLFDDPSYGIKFDCPEPSTKTINSLNYVRQQVGNALRLRNRQGGFVSPGMMGGMASGALGALSVSAIAADLGDAYGRYGYGPEMAHRAARHAGGLAGGLAGAATGAAIGSILGPGGALIGGIVGGIGGGVIGQGAIELGLPR